VTLRGKGCWLAFNKCVGYRIVGALGSELITVSQNPRLVEMLIEYGFLEPHPKWPFEMWDHSETPYRPVVSQFVEVRAGAILKNST